MNASWRLRGYTVEGLLGSGGAGEVWQARVSATGEPVALKKLPVADAVQAERARTEAALLTALDHPHLVRLHALVPMSGAAVLVLDLAAGGSLADLLAARGRLTPGEVITAVAPVAAALAYLHDEGVVHGDVSAANILFTATGVALLADVGVARLVGDDREVTSTPAYVDPAVAGGCVPGPRSDVFMLAAVALHALTGEPLWRGDTAAQTLALAAGADVAAVPARLAAAGVPAAMARVLVRGLQVDPHRRGTAADLALDLRHSGEPVAVELAAGRARPRAVPAGPRHAARPGAARSAAASAARPAFERPSGVPGGVGTAPPTHQVSPPPRPVVPRPVPRARRRAALVVLAAAAAAVLGTGTVWASTGGPSGRAAARLTTAHSTSRTSDPPSPEPTVPARTAASRPASSRPSGSPSPPGRPAAGRTPATSGAAPPRAAPARAVRWPGPQPAAAWQRTVAALDAQRAAAFAARDAAALSLVYRSPALLGADVRLLRRIVPPGCGLAGARTAYSGLRLLTQSRAAAVVTVLARLASSQLVCSGRVRALAPGTGPVRLHIELARVGGAARIAAQRQA